MGYVIRYSHANIASYFFILIYLHISRGIYYGSYKRPRNQVWNIGVIIFLLTMATAFIGKVKEKKNSLKGFVKAKNKTRKLGGCRTDCTNR